MVFVERCSRPYKPRILRLWVGRALSPAYSGNRSYTYVCMLYLCMYVCMLYLCVYAIQIVICMYAILVYVCCVERVHECVLSGVLAKPIWLD